MATIDQNTVVSAAEISLALGITRARVSQLVADKILVKSNSKYPLCENIQRFIDFKVKNSGSTDIERLTAQKLEAEVKLKQSKAEISLLEENELKGKLHRSEDVEAMTSDLIYTIRSALIALPGRLAVDVAQESNPAECAKIVRHEVYAAMEGMSEYAYDPSKYAARVRDRLKWEQVMDDELEDDTP